jgi:hypothetical protein
MSIKGENFGLVLLYIPYLIEQSPKENEDDNKADNHYCQQALSLYSLPHLI